MATAMQFENGLLPEDYVLLTTGGTGLSHGALDTRIPNAANLPNGPFQLTSSTHPYDTYDNSPVHRFYQMWQLFPNPLASEGNPYVPLNSPAISDMMDVFNFHHD
jgi:hypothetical protein